MTPAYQSTIVDCLRKLANDLHADALACTDPGEALRYRAAARVIGGAARMIARIK